MTKRPKSKTCVWRSLGCQWWKATCCGVGIYAIHMNHRRYPWRFCPWCGGEIEVEKARKP